MELTSTMHDPNDFDDPIDQPHDGCETMRIDDQLLKRAKKLAAETGRTLTAVIEDALRLVLSTKKETSTRRKVRLKTCAGHGVQPGVDLDDSAALLDLMDSAGDSR